jgi:ribosome recycling factor
MINDVIADAKDRMDKALEALRHELMSIRTGRAKSSTGRTLEYRLLWNTDLAAAACHNLDSRGPTDFDPALQSRRSAAIEKAIAKSDLGADPLQRRRVDPPAPSQLSAKNSRR